MQENVPQRILVLDTETSGLSKEDKLVEVAWYEVDEGLNIIGSFETLVDPERPISPSASAAHHLTNEDVKYAPTEKELFREVLAGESFDNVWLIAHNAQFDRRFVSPWMNVTKTLCTLRAARKLYPNAENHQMQTLRYMLGLQSEGGDAHRALADVHILYNLLCHLVEVGGCATLQEFHELVEEPIKVTTMPFGAHKGKKLSLLPKKYVEWLFTLDNLDDDLRRSLEAL